MIISPRTRLPDDQLTPAALAKRKGKEQLALDGQNFYRNLGLSPLDPTKVQPKSTKVLTSIKYRKRRQK